MVDCRLSLIVINEFNVNIFLSARDSPDMTMLIGESRMISIASDGEGDTDGLALGE
jgi:hypothetical protein